MTPKNLVEPRKGRSFSWRGLVVFVALLLFLTTGYVLGRSGILDEQLSNGALALEPKLLKDSFFGKILGPQFQEPQEHFVRITKDPTGEPKALQIGISSYRPKSGADVEVTLVGAVHLADKQYFDALNKELKHYDAVLYELIAPKNQRPTTHKSLILEKIHRVRL